MKRIIFFILALLLFPALARADVAGTLTINPKQDGKLCAWSAAIQGLACNVADDDVPDAGDYSNLTGGTGITNSPTGTINTASGEEAFLSSGSLTCGAGTAGKMLVHTTPLQYCDNTATPVLRYSAYGASDGDALAGDSATSFFDTGTIEDARLPSSMADKVFTGSMAIPQGSNPTVDAAGECAVDTTGPQLVCNDGTAARAFPITQTKCIVVERIATADDNMMFASWPQAVTITGVKCQYNGSAPTTPATFTLEDGAGNAMTITGTNPTCTAPGTPPTTAAVTAANTLTANELLRFDTSNTPDPTATDTYMLCVDFVYDRL